MKRLISEEERGRKRGTHSRRRDASGGRILHTLHTLRSGGVRNRIHARNGSSLRVGKLRGQSVLEEMGGREEDAPSAGSTEASLPSVVVAEELLSTTAALASLLAGAAKVTPARATAEKRWRIFMLSVGEWEEMRVREIGAREKKRWKQKQESSRLWTFSSTPSTRGPVRNAGRAGMRGGKSAESAVLLCAVQGEREAEPGERERRCKLKSEVEGRRKKVAGSRWEGVRRRADRAVDSAGRSDGVGVSVSGTEQPDKHRRGGKNNRSSRRLHILSRLDPGRLLPEAVLSSELAQERSDPTQEGRS